MAKEWNGSVELSEEDEVILSLCKKQKLWGFLRRHRHEILDDEVRDALRAMYADGPSGGRPPEMPERVVLAMLLQVGFGVADHEVPSLTVVDRRWQMVLDCLGATKPVLSQGTVFAFRERARAKGFVRLLLNKTLELARRTKDFDAKRLRALIDSSPLVGAGRVEDTFNLLGRAIAQLLEVVADERELDAEQLANDLDIEVFGASSVKAALDVDWRKPEARDAALMNLIGQFESLRTWLRKNVPKKQREESPISDHLEVVERLIEQDTEPDPTPGAKKKKRRIRDGVSPSRLVSLSDRDMRHGRKSKHKTFNGYKRHVAVDADLPGLICAVEVLPANEQESAALPLLKEQLEADHAIAELHIDRGYLHAPELDEMRTAGVRIVSKPPTPAPSEYFSKDAFDIDFASETVTCPNGITIPLKLGKTSSFPRHQCRGCPIKTQCTESSRRSLSIHAREEWYREMAADLATSDGRAVRRERVSVEHVLARVSALQGNRARFKGLDKNRFDLERVAVLNNCYVVATLPAAA